MSSLKPSALSLVLLCALPLVYAQPQPTIIDLSSTPDIPTRIAVQICSGLLNRNTSNAGVYTLMNEPYDTEWLQDLYNINNPVTTPISTFMQHCLSSSASTGYIRYNYSFQHEITPNLITLAAVLNAVLLQDDSPYIHNTSLVFDALSTFSNASALTVSQYMYDHYVNDTTTLAFMDPSPVNPGLIDYIVKEKIFNFFLNDACIRGTAEYDFTLFMTNPEHNPWDNPINVMGYNTAWAVAGDLFEAETDCNSLHNMGQIASDGFNNLAFLSRSASITKPLVQNPSSELTLNMSKIYIAFTVGDGDNLSYLKSSRRNWMKDRVNRCQAADFNYTGCFPLQWSISPHPTYLAPRMIEWYYNQSYLTKQDYFVLPPSGHLYAYPSEMEFDSAQLNFVHSTEADCQLLSCNASVAWEFVFTWDKAIKEYFPRYSENGIINGLFAVNVPFDVPVEEFFIPKFEFFKVFNDNVVLFKPREWRGANYTHCHQAPLDYENCLTPKEMAFEINNYPKSAITHIYITSDGGGDLQMIYDLVPLLEEYVQIVSPTQLIDLALQEHNKSKQ